MTSQAHDRTRALSEVLDQLEATAHDDSITVQEIMEHLGRKSFAALILVFSLLSASPASAIPGLTTMVALAVAIMVVQMLAGRDCLWLPRYLAERRLPTERLCRAVAWLRRPVAYAERFFKARLSFFVKRPGIFLTLAVMLTITAFMPLMEVIPTSGSIASAAIAFFAAAILTRDGALVLAGLIVVAAIPFAVWYALG
ncbi:MAG TPA: exopolysaccharide biosynthesis protein [Afifellaceae bacterium]|nr:exopolysaccharide biosynthesis protein [Afifellaceae bacterium]